MYPTDHVTPEGYEDKEDDSDRTQLRGVSEPSVSAVGVALAPNVLKARFVLEEQLGSGGMGSVYLAKDLRKVEAQDRDPHLAIKVLNADFREHPDAFIALQREAAKSQSLSHPNIVKIYDFDKDGDVPFMTMELLRGNELSDLLRQYPQGLPDTLAWPVIESFCAALKHAHAEGVIHADIKPGNLFVTHSGQLKIFDFGLARAVHANFSQGVMSTRSDVEDIVFDAAALGALTPAFASKAMLHGNSPNAADDLFAAAIVIYQILTGKHPYNRVPADKIDPRSIALERPKQLSARQWRALSSALALDEDNRIVSVATLEAALFEKPQWPMRLLAFSLGCVAITLWFFNLQKDDEIRVVQQQAVQAGRVEAGVDRIVELIESPSFDLIWEQRIDDELNRLSRLRDSARVHGNAMVQISSLYVAKVLETQGLQAAIAFAERGERYGSMAVAWQSISDRLRKQLDAQLAGGVEDKMWLQETESLLAALAAIAQRAKNPVEKHAAALAEISTNAIYIASLDDNLSGISNDVASEILAILDEREFDIDRVDEARGVIESHAEIFAEELQRDQARVDIANFGKDFFQRGCQIDGLKGLRKAHSALRSSGVVSKRDLASRTDRLLAGCTTQLAEVDPDAAASLKEEAVSVFGSLPRTQAVLIDPCDRHYLIGAGARGGRAGTCFDVGKGMPQLVVIPFDSAALAVARYETSNAEFIEFCRQTGRGDCLAGDESDPVANVSVEDAESYAAWLSATTGFHYRLPTLEEWSKLAIAGGVEVDANRNCLVDIGGVSRGGASVRVNVGTPNEFGVVNALGNVAEWATSDDGLLSVGGHFDDPLERCVAGTRDPSSGVPAVTQGIRLVRELSTSANGTGR